MTYTLAYICLFSFKKRRFYCFSAREPDETKESRSVCY